MRYLFSCMLSLGVWQASLAQFTAPRILKHPSQIRVERLDVLNSTYREVNLNVSPDGKYLFFMSGRGGQPWSTPRDIGFNGKMEFDGDIWYSQKSGNLWSYPQCLGQNVNTYEGEDEPNISPDGQTVTYQSWAGAWHKKGGPYYQANLSANAWGLPTAMGGGINSFFIDKAVLQEKRSGPNNYATDGATLSADGKTFIVAVGEYDGKMDLFISRKNAYGQWSYLTRLAVSSLGDERSPFLASDGKTLYFASDGYGGWGGLDIFKTTLNDDNSNGAIINLGSPFNTYLNDFGFILIASGDEAYFVREDDIYFADTKDANSELKPSSSTLMLAGKITNAKTGKPMWATVKVIDNKTKAILATVNGNAYTGEYAIILPTSATDFSQEVTQKDFEKDSQTFKVEIKTGLNQVKATVALKPVEKTVINNPPIVVEKPQDREAQAGCREKDVL